MKRSEFLSRLPISVFGILSLELINSCQQRKHAPENASVDSFESKTKEKLWLFYNSILDNWGLKGFSTITKSDFDAFLENRIQFNIKYLHAYNVMAHHIPDYNVNFNAVHTELSDLHDADIVSRIIKEFQTYGVVNGGFR